MITRGKFYVSASVWLGLE